MPSRSAVCHASRTWPEDLALADDHRVEAGGHPEEVRDRGVVVVRVQLLREVRRGRHRSSRRGSGGRRRRRRGTGSCGRRPRCGCTSRAARPRRGARGPRGRGAPWAARRDDTVMRSSRSTAAVRWFSPTTTRDTPREAPWPRPGGRRGSDRACPNRGHAANRPSRSSVPPARTRSRASESSSSSSAHSGPISWRHVVLEVRGQRRAPPAGPDR